ncbi:MAG: NTPase [Candidatus Bathyarchaeia archaeon]
MNLFHKVVSMAKRLLLLTGQPGVGKTTLLMKVVNALKHSGYSVGGMISREVRERGVRVGFELLDLNSGNRCWLAHVKQPDGPRIGKYRVNLRGFEKMGVSSIVEAVEKMEVVVVDEVGPMELFSEKFKEAVWKAVESGKLVVSVVHWKSSDRLVDEIKARADAEVFEVTLENRQNLHEIVVKKAVEFLTKR